MIIKDLHQSQKSNLWTNWDFQKKALKLLNKKKTEIIELESIIIKLKTKKSVENLNLGLDQAEERIGKLREGNGINPIRGTKRDEKRRKESKDSLRNS